MLKKLVFMIMLPFILFAVPQEKDAATQFHKGRGIKDHHKAIEAFKAVEQYYPDSKYVFSSHASIAHRYRLLKEYQKAIEIYYSQLKSGKLHGEAGPSHLRLLIECREALGEDREEISDQLMAEFPNLNLAIIFDKINIVWVNLIRNPQNKEHTKNTINKINDWLKDIYLNYKLDFKQSMAIKEYIAKLPLAALHLEIKLDKLNGKKFKGTLTNSKLVTLNITRPTGLHKNSELMLTPEGLEYIDSLQNNLFRSATTIISQSLRENDDAGNLNEKAIRAIEYLEKYEITHKNKKGLIEYFTFYEKRAKDEFKPLFQPLIEKLKNLQEVKK